MLTRNTVEEKIRVLQHQKTALVTNVLGDEGFASNLDMEDLQFILTHGANEEDDEDDIIENPTKPAKKAAKKAAKRGTRR
ncbi:MAG: hypothetical protein ACSHX6_14185 [Akkermansiaceae bacterium]